MAVGGPRCATRPSGPAVTQAATAAAAAAAPAHGSRSPSLLESLLASLDEVLGSGALARRLGDIAGMGSRSRRV